MKELPKNYEPKDIEPRLVKKWGEEPFRADATSSKPPFTIVIPPPNVTGSLHLGHALDNTLIDVLIRYKRMAGFEALYLPGTDHAGISTQWVVVKELAKEGIDRHSLGREKFLAKVWEWKEQSGGEILYQLKRLGVSCDWTRERFTMDEGLSRAVRHQFIQLYHQGLAYRSERMVNWDVLGQTTLSDLEVDREERQVQLVTLSYKLDNPETVANGEAGEIRIATVRPETIFADQAIAVHPEDERFSHLVGQKARIPLTHTYIPIIFDSAVEKDFGTGALKVTPAHDPTDFDIGQRHNLATPSVIDLHGNLTSDLVPEPFRGMERFAARKAVIQALEEAGAVVERKDHKAPLAISERSKAPVEPMISLQWFVDMQPLAQKALDGIEAGEIRLHPERYTKVNKDWLSNIRDWCISRQLWWGHQIPAWYDAEGNIYVPSPENPDLDCDQDPQYAHLNLQRDPDVFDTWFSSNLWPFSTLGYPETDDEDYQKFYPTQVLVTGYDILFFWVARMQMAGYHFTAQAPFSDVLLHGLYLDAKGQKMSKSKGNGINPLELFDTYGVDACRFAFASMATGGQDIRHDARRYEQGKVFANKLWNAARFVMMNLETEAVAGEKTLADRWILSRLNQVTRDVREALDAFDIAAAMRLVYSFTWDEFCDWYIEAAKPALKEGNSATRENITQVLEGILKLLHPFMPFITTEIYQALGHKRQIAVHSFPEYSPEQIDQAALQAFSDLRHAVNSARSLKSELGLAPQDRVQVSVSGEGMDNILENMYVLESIAKVEYASMLSGKTLSQVAPRVVVSVPLEGTVNIAEWVAKQRKRLTEMDKQIQQAKGKLGNANFVANAPKEVIEEEQRRVQDFSEQKERLQYVLGQFS